jgi:hypothetical protein
MHYTPADDLTTPGSPLHNSPVAQRVQSSVKTILRIRDGFETVSGQRSGSGFLCSRIAQIVRGHRLLQRITRAVRRFL